MTKQREAEIALHVCRATIERVKRGTDPWDWLLPAKGETMTEEQEAERCLSACNETIRCLRGADHLSPSASEWLELLVRRQNYIRTVLRLANDCSDDPAKRRFLAIVLPKCP